MRSPRAGGALSGNIVTATDGGGRMASVCRNETWGRGTFWQPHVATPLLVTGATALGALAVAVPGVASAAAVTIAAGLAGRGVFRLIGRSPDKTGETRPSSTMPVLAQEDLERVEDRIWTLSESELRFRETLDWQSEIILRRDANGALNFVNRAFSKTFGVAWEDVIGTHFVPPVLERGVCVENAKPIERILTVRGPRWFAWDEARIPRADSADDDIQLVGRDVTDQRRFEHELAEARDAAEAANRAKSRFLAAMSHEIRTPMNGVIGLARLLSQTDLQPTQRTFVDGVVTSADYLRSLLNDVLDFSRIEAGQLKIERTPFVVSELLDDARLLTSAKAEAKGLPVVLEVDEESRRPLLGDPLRLRQIFVNLIDNAIKFTEAGSVTVRASVEPSNKARAKAWETYRLRVSIDDTGRGFGGHDPEMLFHEFEQAHASDAISADGLEGAGLGLSICRRLAVAMGGQITAVERTGGGASFMLTVELAAAPHRATSSTLTEPAISSTASISTARRTRAEAQITDAAVLIVEDNPINAMVARASVERIGFASETVSSGENAIERLVRPADASGGGPEAPIFAVLLDLKLPGISGFDVIDRLNAEWSKDEAGTPRPYLIALTAHAFTEDRERCLAAGFDAHVAKPFDPDTLEYLLCVAATRRTAVAG